MMYHHHHHRPVLIRFFFVSEGGRMHLIPSAIAPTPSLIYDIHKLMYD